MVLQYIHTLFSAKRKPAYRAAADTMDEKPLTMKYGMMKKKENERGFQFGNAC
ncbi:hypothetical protein STFR1_80085 [Bacillus vallismortis]